MKTLHWMIVLIALITVVSGCRNGQISAGVAGSRGAQVTVERVVGNLTEPVALVFLSKDIWLVAERRSGAIRWIEQGKLRPAPFATVAVPTVSGYNEFGLLGLAVDPDYPTHPYVYAFHTIPGSGNRATGQRVVRFTVRNGQGVEPKTIIDNLPAGASCCHNGGRILFGPDGKLYVTLGDTQRQETAQDYGALAGKVLRYIPDGAIPGDNPLEEQRTSWAGTEGERAQQLGGMRTPVYTIGHRNPFGIAVNPANSEVYITENGPNRGDEINRLVAGDNYGWPEVVGYSDDPRFRSPLWSSSNTQIAPTGATFYTGTEFPQFSGNLFFAAYNDGKLRRAVLDSADKISSVQEVPAAGNNARLDVVMGPDGYLYFTSMNAIYRLRGGE